MKGVFWHWSIDFFCKYSDAFIFIAQKKMKLQRHDTKPFALINDLKGFLKQFHRSLAFRCRSIQNGFTYKFDWASQFIHKACSSLLFDDNQSVLQWPRFQKIFWNIQSDLRTLHRPVAAQVVLIYVHKSLNDQIKSVSLRSNRLILLPSAIQVNEEMCQPIPTRYGVRQKSPCRWIAALIVNREFSSAF